LEFGTLFVRAQRFADETANEAEQKAQEVISAAEAKAAEIIERATDAERVAQAKVVSTQAEVAAITEPARQQARPIAPQTHPPTEAIATLSAAIEECTDTNRTLASELVKLRLTLGESFAAVPQA
jgi:regulatory protein YycI of two-component signal transduction system YycFG